MPSLKESAVYLRINIQIRSPGKLLITFFWDRELRLDIIAVVRTSHSPESVAVDVRALTFSSALYGHALGTVCEMVPV